MLINTFGFFAGLVLASTTYGDGLYLAANADTTWMSIAQLDSWLEEISRVIDDMAK